jgi:hypothetical protein
VCTENSIRRRRGKRTAQARIDDRSVQADSRYPGFALQGESNAGSGKPGPAATGQCASPANAEATAPQQYAAAPRIPLALFVLGAIYKQATSALLILGALAGAMQLLDAGIGLFEHDLGKFAGPLFLAVLQFFVVYLLHRSTRITPQTKRG